MAFYRCGGGADTSIVTALAEDVLSQKVIVDAEGNPLTGTMPNNGAVSPSALNCGGSYTIPKGYHNGNGKVTANSLASQTSANATAGNILTGKTAWVNGSKVTGTMKNNGAVSQTLSAGGSYTIPAGYHNGSGKVTANSLDSQGALNSLIGSVNLNTGISGSAPAAGSNVQLFSVPVSFSPKYVILECRVKVTNGTLTVYPTIMDFDFVEGLTKVWIPLASSNISVGPLYASSTNFTYDHQSIAITCQFYVEVSYSEGNLICNLRNSKPNTSGVATAIGTCKYKIFG